MSPPAAASVTDDKRESTLDKVRKLINLAASPNLREAERAAHKACALIRDMGLDVCDPDEIDAVYRSLADRDARIHQLESGPAPDTPPSFVAASYSYAAMSQPAAAPQPPMTAPTFLQHSKFAGQCKFCRARYNAGDPIRWWKGVGSWCGTKDCYQQWAAQCVNPFGSSF
jgi:hypothetical protein